MIGTTISQYKIQSKLGEGGMGEVYLAEDTKLGRKVALKVLPEAMAEDPERLERFQREAKAIAALNHPNIITIYNVEEAGGQRFLIMEMVEGESLDKVIPPGGMPLPKVFDIAIPMADALSAAHEKGIVHRDLKPANVMVTPEGRVKVLDFGLAKVATEPLTSLRGDDATQTAGLTTEGTIMGTAPYMSPEQLHGQGVDHRTDIFSLGIVLYEMVAGQRPFKGESGIDLASSILKDTPATLTDVRAELPRHLARIIHTCLDKDPRRRYQSALDVRNELDRLKDEVKSGSVSMVSGPMSASQPAYESGPSSAIGSGPASAIGPGSVAVAPPGPDSAVASGPSSAIQSGAIPAPGSKGKGLWIGIVAAVVILALLGAWWMGRGGSQPEAATRESDAPVAASVSTTPSVAVLPFADMSPDQDQEYFTDGMTEELLQALASIDGLKVPSRTAIFALKGKGLDIQQVGERLGVSTVLEGSVRKAGEQLRISAQLVQVSDGFELWSDSYDRTLEDVFAVQDEIASNIAAALQLTLVEGSGATSSELGGTDDTGAYDFFLRGEDYSDQGGTEGARHAVQMYTQAVELDPDYAQAYVGLTISHWNLYHLAGASQANLEAADQASSKALELAPSMAAAYTARAAYLEIAGDLPAATSMYETAIRLDPNRHHSYNNFATMLYRQGDLVRAAELFEKSAELDSEDRNSLTILPQLYRSLGENSKVLGANARMLAAEERHLELNPDDANSRLLTAFAFLELGQREQAFERAGQVLSSETEDSAMLYNIGCFYSVAGDVDAAFDALEKAVAAGYSQPEWWRQDSDLDNVREDPRFEALVQRMESGS